MNLSPKIINLADYTKPNFEVNNVYLDFQLDKTNTIVKNTMQISRLSEGSLVLNGENIDLISVKINNQILKKEQYRVTNSKLIINDTPNKFSLEIINTINP
jgi:aminopeptidase N